MGLERRERLGNPAASPYSTRIVRQKSRLPVQETAVSDASTPAITIYSTAVCPYCVMAKNFLKSKGREWTEVRIDTDPAEREKMVALTRRTSVPQIFVGDVHVGGYDDMMALHREGKLEPLLEGKPA
jgi:glutaredoxin 3